MKRQFLRLGVKIAPRKRRKIPYTHRIIDDPSKEDEYGEKGQLECGVLNCKRRYPKGNGVTSLLFFAVIA